MRSSSRAVIVAWRGYSWGERGNAEGRRPDSANISRKKKKAEKVDSLFLWTTVSYIFVTPTCGRKS